MENAEPRILDVAMETPFGPLKGRLALPPGEVRLSEFAASVMGLADRLVGMAVRAESAAGREVACRAGCGACCRQAVPLSPAEAWMLADLVASLPVDRRAAVIARFEAAHRRLSEAGFGDRSTSGDADRQEILALGLDYFRLGIPCPFLEEESCSIHPRRPTACREYLVTTPPERCADPGGQELAGVPLAANLTEALSRVCARMLGGEPEVIPLTQALAWAAETREAGRRRYDPETLMRALFEEMASGEV